MKRKVIEDSDDEEQPEASPQRPLATGLSDITLSTIVSLDGSSSHDIPEQTADPSTSSTELLNRESRAAHESLIEPTPKSTLPATTTIRSSSQQHIPTSPTASQLKTKRSKTSVEKPKAKKALKTYGKSSQDIFEFHGGSDGELDTMPRKDLGHKAGNRKGDENVKVRQAVSRWGSQGEDVTRRTVTSSGGDTELLSTEPKRHEMSSSGEKKVFLESSMPPPAPKSTSSEQSQRSQNSTMPMIAELAPPKPPTNDTLPPTESAYYEYHSEDRMSASAKPVDGESDNGNSRALPQSVNYGSMRSSVVKHIEPQQSDGPAPSSSASEISPSRTITVRRTNQVECVSEKPGSYPDSKHLGSQLDPSISAMINPVVKLPAPTDTEGAQDELSLSIPEAASKSPIKPAKASKRKRDTDDEPFDELGFADDAIGIPREHYQPRPSKRRSGNGDGEILLPIDFSKRPEAVGKGKRKTKRHKTTAFQELLPKDEDEDEEEEIKVVPDSRFDIPEKKSSKIFADSDLQDVQMNGNTEEIRPDAHQELNQAAKSTGQKKRGRPKKVTTNLSEEIAVDEPEADNDQEHAETEEPFISAAAKKSRKKSRIKNTQAVIVDEQDGNKDVTSAAEDDPEELPANILNETHGNITPLKLPEKPLSETSPVKANAPPETPHKSTTPAPKGPDKHSPIGSGKVAFRVGLSKRARIAPLLRIVRK